MVLEDGKKLRCHGIIEGSRQCRMSAKSFFKGLPYCRKCFVGAKESGMIPMERYITKERTKFHRYTDGEFREYLDSLKKPAEKGNQGAA